MPENHAGIEQGLFVIASEVLARIPHGHLLHRHAHGLGGVAAQVLVREEEDPLAALEGPFENRGGIGGRADDAAVLATEALEGGGGVHVGDRDDRNPAVGVRLGAKEFLKLLPALGDGIDVRHVRHGAARGEVRQDDRLVRLRQDVRGLGHEVDSAEDDGLGVGPGERGVGQLKGVAHEVGVFNDLVPLVEVPQDDGLVPEGSFGRPDTGVQFGVAGLLVFLRQLALARRGGGGDVGA
ncbi:hypothetical protein D9M72_343690 [compost metagenome]